MTRNDVTEMIVAARLKKGISWAEVAKVFGANKEWVKIVMSGKFLSYKEY